MVFYRAANRIYQDPPLAYVNMADIFTSANQTDSALLYFGRAAQTQPTDSAMIKLRNQAAFNYGVLLLNTGKSREAIAALHQYLALQPDDVAAKKGLAQAFRAAGMADSAQVIERELVAGAGVAAAAAGAEDALSDADLFDLATRQYNDKNYSEAASSYGRLLQRNPNHRDALHAQANSYLALQQGAGLISAAQKLVALDPLGEYNYQLLAQGYKFEKKQDKLAETIIAEYALPVDLQFGEFVASADNASFTAKAVGREARDENNKIIPPRPLTIMMEFLARDGSVLASQDAAIAAVKTGESNPVRVQAKATGVRAWRYRVK
jgi:tetratricopeptide (TPR) repeat protein